ncbi:MAG: hypothetical protein JWM12_1332 [Ilumatobacteraceae bacterium]|nr:hypothetical protein [Ilumatobacteraceae bacterium]
MRTRRKLTAIGALTLAGSAVVGGALVTSHAMAASTTPTKGTITVVSMQAGADSAIQCTYDGVDLPSPAGVPGSGGAALTGAVAVPPDGGPNLIVRADGDGPQLVSGTAEDGSTVGDPAVGGAVGEGTPVSRTDQSGATTYAVGQAVSASPADRSDGPATQTAGSPAADGSLPPDLTGVPAIVLDSKDARPGTAEECAALQPSTMVLPLQPPTSAP